MPLIIARGFSSIQNFGHLSSLPLTTYIFPSGYSTFTVPVGVTNLKTLVGKGADGTSDSWAPPGSGSDYLASLFVAYPIDPGAPTISSSYTIGDAYNATISNYNSIVGSISATSPPGSYVSNWTFYEWFTNWPSAGQNEGDTSSFGSGYYYKSSPSIYWYGTPFTSGNSTLISSLTSQTDAHLGGLYKLTPGSPGSPTSGFGKTFPAGASNTPASLTTFTNVAVTPGQSYPISNYGSLSVTY